jgi:hypothetical protein
MAKDSFSDYVPYDQQPGVKKKNNLVIILTGVFVLFVFILGSTTTKNSGNQDKRAVASSSTPTQTAAVRESDECTTIRTDITMLRTSFSVAEDTPQQVSFLLEAARNDFNNAASSFSGSKSDWLLKMAELSGKISSFIITGIPEDGPQALDQLYANMNLVDQFCD